MNPVQEVARLRQKLLYSNGTLQLPNNSSGGGLQVCAPVRRPFWDGICCMAWVLLTS